MQTLRGGPHQGREYSVCGKTSCLRILVAYVWDNLGIVFGIILGEFFGIILE